MAKLEFESIFAWLQNPVFSYETNTALVLVPKQCCIYVQHLFYLCTTSMAYYLSMTCHIEKRLNNFIFHSNHILIKHSLWNFKRLKFSYIK